MKKFILITLLLLGFAFNGNSHTYTQYSAEEFIKHSLEVDIQELVNADVSEEGRLAEFLPFMEKNINIEHLVKYTIRADNWHNATTFQKNTSIYLMRLRAAKLYIKHFEKIKGGKVDIKKTVEKSSLISIKTEITLVSGVLLNVTFEISRNIDGKFQIKDMIVENLRISSIIRSHFRESIKKDGIAGLIGQLKKETS